MKKTIIFSAAIFIFSFAFSVSAGEKEKESASASVKITGKIVDNKTGEALAGVLIKLDDINLTSYSDLDGNFEINGLAPGTYNISTSLISYETLKIDVDALKPQNKVQLSLETVSRKK